MADRAGFVAPEDPFARRLQQLAHVTARLAAADTMDTIVDIVVSHVADAIGAAVATLMTRSGDDLDLVGAHGVRAGVEVEFAKFGIADQNPASEAVRTGTPVVLGDSAAIQRRYPVLQGRMPAGRSLICLPLNTGNETLGVIGLTFEQSWLPGARELDFLTTFADSCAQAIRRVRAIAEAQENARRLAFLADVSAELAASLDYWVTLADVAKLVVPTLADWCAVDVVHDGRLTTVAVAHVDPAKVDWAWQLQERYPADPDAPTGSANVVRTGVSELYPVITDAMLVEGARDDEHLRLTRELDLRSALVVPLLARGRTLGSVTLLRTAGAVPYDESDLAIAEDLARRAGVAVDNAQLYEQTQDVARQLQRAVLPDDLTAISGWQIASHYRPGGLAEIGGDFYDAVPLSENRLAVFIGDVAGHGVAAAAAMAQLRSATRAFLSIDPDPGAVVAALDGMFTRLGITQLATLVYVVIDSRAATMRMVSAGHYPPLVVSAAGTHQFAEAVPQRPLGAGGDHREVTSWALCPDDTVLLYTDGLVERRAESIDVGLRRLRDEAGALSAGDLAAALRDLVAVLHDDRGDDDVTAIAVRIAPPE